MDVKQDAKQDAAGTSVPAAEKKKKKKKKPAVKPSEPKATKPKPAVPSKTKTKTKTAAQPKTKAKAKPKATPIHKDDIFRPQSRLGAAFALLKDGKPHSKKEVVAAIKKRCGDDVKWPHRIFGHLRARAAETGEFLLKEPERGVYVLTLLKKK